MSEHGCGEWAVNQAAELLRTPPAIDVVPVVEPVVHFNAPRILFGPVWIPKLYNENKDKTFFAYLPVYSVHTKLDAPEVLVKKYKDKFDDKYGKGEAEKFYGPGNIRHEGDHLDNPYIAAMLERIDAGVGQIMQTLEETGLTIEGESVAVFERELENWLSDMQSDPNSRSIVREMVEAGLETDATGFNMRRQGGKLIFDQRMFYVKAVKR